MYRESIFNLYDNSGVSTAKIVSIHSTKRKFIRIGDYVTVFPQKYKLNKKHIKQKQKYTGLVIGMRR